MNTPSKIILARQAIHHWLYLGSLGEISVIDSGLVNWTFLVKLGEQSYILQKLHPVFTSRVHQDIEAVTAHLTEKHLLVPRLIGTEQGELCINSENGCWRLQNLIAGRSWQTIQSVDMAQQAGSLVGDFHVAMSDFKHDYCFSRAEAHNTPLYLSRLQLALLNYQHHHLYSSVQDLAGEILRVGATLPNLWLLPNRHSHGDLKVGNFLCDERSNCIAIIDWDTVGLLPWPLELGDALRSWCNPQGEDAAEVRLDKNIFSAALDGYAARARHLWSASEIAALVDGLLVITLELAARFLTDALVERYFSYNPQQFSSLGHHNLVRARAQWQLHQNIACQAADLRQIVAIRFKGSP